MAVIIKKAEYTHTGSIFVEYGDGTTSNVVDDMSNRERKMLFDWEQRAEKNVIKPYEPTLEGVLSDALRDLNLEHAAILRQLTGDATIEERDTWLLKALASAAYAAGTADAYQTDMLETEAAMAGEPVADLVAKVLEKNAAFQKMVGLASGHRRATEAAFRSASSIEELEAAVLSAREKAQQLVGAFLSGGE